LITTDHCGQIAQLVRHLPTKMQLQNAEINLDPARCVHTS